MAKRVLVTKRDPVLRPPGGRADKAEDRRWFDPTFKMMAVKILPGEHYVSSAGEEMIVTVLGSCIAACVWDPVAKVGGMNHFMLPDSAENSSLPTSKAMLYGNFAMEELINDLLRRGVQRNTLEVKIFGAGNVVSGIGGGGQATIGDRNTEFIRRYLEEEGYTIAAEDLGGNHPRRVHFFPRTGKVVRLFLKMDTDRSLIEREQSYRARLQTQDVEGDVELFS